MSQLEYPVPTTKPTYTASGHKIGGERSRSVAEVFEYLFVVLAFGLTLWLAWLLLLKSSEWSLNMIGWLIAFWALIAYFALPKLHQFLTSLYVPNYFIARTRTGDGLLGDPVNLALDGTEDDIHAAMTAAGWVKADEITLTSSLGIINSSLLGKSYPEAPVSDLFLFGERHAFAYQQEVDGNAAQRHHIRFWTVPEGWVLPGGHKAEWLAAGTYDRAVGLSLFTGQITHKIDANIDLERDYVINTVLYADPHSSVHVIKDFSTAYHHRNGGGDTVSTDGHLPVLNVTGAYTRSADVKGTTTRTMPSEHSDSPKKRLLPPLPFLIMGIMLTLSVLALVATWVIIGATGDLTAVDGIETSDLYVASALVGVMYICWFLTLGRYRWARILLIAAATIGAIQDLLTATGTEVLSAVNLMSAALALFLLWSVCGQAMSRWISPAE